METSKGNVAAHTHGNVLLQFVAAAVVSLQAGQYGIMGGWASPSDVLYQSDDTPLPRPLSVEESSWVTAIMTFGGVAGTFVYGYIANKYGRKWPFISLTIPLTISWLLIALAQSPIYLYGAYTNLLFNIFVGRFLHGFFAGSIYLLCQFYFVEISDDRVRGALCGSLVLAGHIGVVVAFLLGAYSTYFSYSIVAIALSFLFVVIFSFFPETPIFLLKQNKLAEAKKSIRFYKNMRSPIIDQKLIDMEIERLKSTLQNTEQQHSNKSSFKWSEFSRNPGRKALIIGIVLAALNHVTGSYALLNYTSTIFKASGSIVSPNESALIIGIIQLIGTFIVPVLIDRSGRKILYSISTFGAAVGFGILGVYMMLKDQHYAVESFNWIPLTCFGAIVFVQSLGVSTLSYTVTAEIMPENLKEAGVSIANLVLATSGFLVLKFMPTLSNALGFHYTMFFFGAVSLPCGLFIVFYVPETKGKSYQEIMKSLS